MIDLPPCINKILKDKTLLKKHAKILLRFVSQYKPEAFTHFLKHLLNEGVNVSLDMDIFNKPFNCNELVDLCSKDCPLYQDIFAWLKENTHEVFITSDEENNAILVVKLKDGNVIKLNLGSDNVGRSFVSQIATLYKRYIDLDLRRKKDRQQWKDLMEFWVSKAKEVNMADVSEEDEYIRNIALDYLYRVQVKPANAWKGDPTSAVTKDGMYALFLKDALRTYISTRINKRISFKKLSSLLAPEVESVWVMIDGVRYAFYKYKMTEEQRQKYKKYYEELIKEETESEKESSQNESHDESGLDQESWDLSDVLKED